MDLLVNKVERPPHRGRVVTADGFEVTLPDRLPAPVGNPIAELRLWHTIAGTLSKVSTG